MSTESVTSTSSATSTTTSDNSIASLDPDAFLELLIAELQNQDPLAPMETSEMLQQISLIGEISSTNSLIDALDTVTIGQNLSTASSLIGKSISAIDSDGYVVEGVIDRVSIEVDDDDNRSVLVHIGDSSINLENISDVYSSDE